MSESMESDGMEFWKDFSGLMDECGYSRKGDSHLDDGQRIGLWWRADGWPMISRAGFAFVEYWNPTCDRVVKMSFSHVDELPLIGSVYDFPDCEFSVPEEGASVGQCLTSMLMGLLSLDASKYGPDAAFSLDEMRRIISVAHGMGERMKRMESRLMRRMSMDASEYGRFSDVFSDAAGGMAMAVRSSGKPGGEP